MRRSLAITLALSSAVAPSVGDMAGSVEPSVGRLAAPDRHTVWSTGGSFRLEVVFGEVGFDDLSVERIFVWEGDVLRWAADRPAGNGFYVSNLGSVAAIEASEAFPARGRARPYNPNGDRVITVDVPFAHGFQFARDADVFAVSGLETTLVLDAATGSVRRYPPLDRVALSSDGTLVEGHQSQRLTFMSPSKGSPMISAASSLAMCWIWCEPGPSAPASSATFSKPGVIVGRGDPPTTLPMACRPIQRMSSSSSS